MSQFCPFFRGISGLLLVAQTCNLPACPSSPRTFTKVLIAVLALLRVQGLRVYHYLDNVLLLARDLRGLLTHRVILIDTLQKFGLDDQHQEEQACPNPAICLPGGTLQYDQCLGLNPASKGVDSQEQGPESSSIHPPVSIPLSQPVGHHILVDSHAPLGTLAHAAVLVRVPCTVEETVPNTSDNSIFQHKEEPTVVAEGDSEEPAPLRSIRLDHCYNRCQQGRLGGTLQRTVCPGQEEIPSQRHSLEYTRGLNSILSSHGITAQDQGQTGHDADGKQGSGCLYTMPGRNPQ